MLVKTVGLTRGINPPNSPTTVVAISRFQRFPEDTDSIIANVDVTPPTSCPDSPTGKVLLEHSQQWQGCQHGHTRTSRGHWWWPFPTPGSDLLGGRFGSPCSHLAESTRTLSDQARRMEAFPDEALWALGLIKEIILPCILKPFPLQGTDNSLYRLCIFEKTSRQRGVCVDHLHRCKTSFCLFCVLFNNFLAMYAGGGSRVQSLPPTKTLWFPWWYMAWSAMRTCQFSEMGRGSTQEPPSRRIVKFDVLHCCRNLELFLTV